MHPEYQLATRRPAVLEVAAVKKEALDEKRRGNEGTR
jgi:hypothetical protein